MKKSLIVVYSYHHRNTEKIAGAMAKVLGCEIAHPGDKTHEDISGCDIVGFGAGIDSGKHYAPMLEFARKLAPVQGKKAFIFSTSAILGAKKVKKDHLALREILISKGYEIADEFACKGYNTNSFLKFIGGMNKGRPDERDLGSAADFAGKLMNAAFK